MALVSAKACGCTCGEECPITDGPTPPKEGVVYCAECMDCIRKERKPADVQVTPEDIAAIAEMVYDDVTVTADQYAQDVAGYSKDVAAKTLARARTVMAFLAKCGDKDEGLQSEVDGLAKLVEA